MECLSIADDLTGACDAVAPFAGRGLRTVVLPFVDAPVPDADVVAISTETRDCEAAELAAAMAAAARRFRGASPRILFKKIDSTLRGHPAAEIEAAREAFGCRSTVVCPAFPAMHRVVEHGVLKVTTDPEFVPIRVEPDWPDAVCDADLDAIAARTGEPPVLWAGSAGLAAALARTIHAVETVVSPLPPAGPVVLCIGSDHPVTRRQIADLAASKREHVLVRVARGTPPEGLPGRPGALVLSGGDTAALVCRALGVEAIELYDELSPGIPRGVLRGGAWEGTAVVTKSGGFGAPDALVRIVDFFACPTQQTCSQPSL
jgi:uncharacterized protein YgbK (DUF1537 family)